MTKSDKNSFPDVNCKAKVEYNLIYSEWQTYLLFWSENIQNYRKYQISNLIFDSKRLFYDFK